MFRINASIPLVALIFDFQVIFPHLAPVYNSLIISMTKIMRKFLLNLDYGLLCLFFWETFFYRCNNILVGSLKKV